MRKEHAFTQCSRTRLWKRLLSTPSQGSSSILRGVPKGVWGRMTLPPIHSYCTSRQTRLGHRCWFAYPSSWPSSSHSFYGRSSLSTTPLHGFCSYRSRWPNVVIRTCTLSGSFPHDDNNKRHNSLCLPPLPISPPPRISGFHVLYTRTRVSIRHVCRFYQMCCSPSASLVKAHSSIVLPLSLVCQLLSLFISSIPGRPQRSSPLLLLNH